MNGGDEIYTLRIYKLNNTYKYVSMPIINSNVNVENDYRHYNFNKDKINNNLIRAKTTIKDLILCNDFNLFVTITINSNYDRFNLQHIRKLVNNRIRYIRFYYGANIKFIFVPEQHKNGAWHLHGVISGVDDYISYNKNGYPYLTLFDSLGYTSISFIRSIDHISSYVTKYITKDLDKLQAFKHCYFASHGLNRPQLIDSCIYSNTDFNHQFFKDGIVTDYCYVKYVNKCYNFVTTLR